MQLRFQEFDDFVLFFKPNGIRMHQVDDGQFGFVEAASGQLQQQLLIVHRLDKETSGLVLFARSKQAAALLTELFEDHLIQKTYFFLTDRSVSKKSFSVKTHIEKVKNAFVNSQILPANSETELQWVKSLGIYNLWKASPKSGKPHQIRLHAESAGIPILGDSAHGGSKWHRLALHATELEFSLHGKQHHFSAALPPSFENPSESPIASLFADSLFNTSQLFHFNKNDCFQLISPDGQNLGADVYGRHLWVYDYSEHQLKFEDTQAIQSFAMNQNLSSSIRHMLDRGVGVGGKEGQTLNSAGTETAWLAEENKMQFQLRTDAGFSPGLFLDQRENRKFVQRESTNKKVLNLFSYTAGFSVAAAIGGAAAVTTVDTSKKFLEWSKVNFKLNSIPIESHEFFAQDCLLFLKGAKKRSRLWDLIICDPPSFGRSADSIWKIEKDLAELAGLMFASLVVGGQILFTCNYEKWNRSQLITEFCKILPKKRIKMDRLPFLSLDLGETDDFKNGTKGFLLTKLAE